MSPGGWHDSTPAWRWADIRSKQRLYYALTVLLLAIPVSFTLYADAHALTIAGRTSVYGGPCDPGDNNITATGIPNTVPGVAIYRRDTFRSYFVLTRPRTGRRVVIRHVDYGPAPWTGKTLDLNPPAAKGLGFTVTSGGCVLGFPTGERMSAKLISRRGASRWAKRTRTTVDDRWIWRPARAARLPANYGLWLRIGRCEQPGRQRPGGIYWSHPGPTYGGGLGIYLGTWRAFAPRGFPSTPGRATWRQQMQVANRIKARFGVTAWGCGRR